MMSTAKELWFCSSIQSECAPSASIRPTVFSAMNSVMNTAGWSAVKFAAPATRTFAAADGSATPFTVRV
jgi:hypothetical protein